MSEQNAETHGKTDENDMRGKEESSKASVSSKDYPFYAEKLKTLPLSNDFMFGQVMQSTKICQLFLESVLERPIGKLQNIQQQFAVKDTLYARGVRLDVYLQDTKVSIYNIEMQSTPQQFLEKRYRYYQSQLDQHTLHPGQHYSELKDIYVIFICNFDYFGCGQAVYRCKMVIENCPTALYQDGVHFYLLNAQHREKQINPALQEFLDTVRDNNWTVDGSKTKLGKMVRNEVMRVREDRKVGEKYMSYAMRLQDRYMEGVQKGRKEGELHGKMEMLLSLVRLDMIPLAEAANLAGKSEAEFQKLLAQE